MPRIGRCHAEECPAPAALKRRARFRPQPPRGECQHAHLRSRRLRRRPRRSCRRPRVSRVGRHRQRPASRRARTRLPYARPPLSKDYLRGELAAAELPLEDVAWYAAREIVTALDTPVRGLDPSGRRLLLGAETIAFETVLLATGASPRHPPRARPVTTPPSSGSASRSTAIASAPPARAATWS